MLRKKHVFFERFSAKSAIFSSKIVGDTKGQPQIPIASFDVKFLISAKITA